MKKLTFNQQRTLKTFHLIFAGVWLTCVFLLLCLPFVVTNFSSGDDLYLYNKIYHFIDLAVLSPSAAGTLLTGLLYSLLTPWGFFKHGWLIYKWIITLLVIGVGTFYLGPMVSKLLLIAGEKKFLAIQDEYYIESQLIGIWAAIINSILLIIAVVVSVFKPKMK
ncbi:MAG: hypothetical protein HQK50_18145 [Oligoflexia bacterium]|nr:hypothetical protein [Oligoflexia bacterium]MBF0367501.1 hypothetical protein [Oligoflexia bacterium]